MSNTTRDTGKALLPALPPVNAQDASLRNWMKAVTERLEVREGTRGNPFERAVTVREIKELTEVAQALKEQPKQDGNTVAIQIGNGLSASVAIDKFVDSIRQTRLYRDLMKRLDDPTRFDDVVKEVRDLLLTSITDEAKKRGADVRRLDTLIQDANRSLAYAVQEVTAALGENAAGVREVTWAFADASQAQAGKIAQLEASLGNYYADGSPGRANLEEQMFVSASYTEGLRAQYTLKVMAGGALAGFGIAAEEVNGVPSSAFIISADKFAIVSPSYVGGLTPSPNANHIPFGVDANGIYLNNNVYVRGQMRVDTGGKTLADGLRGSLDVAAMGTAWSDNTARQAIWTALGKSGSATDNNHLVIGDAVTISGTNFVETRYWTGSAWGIPGAIINGNLLVNGSVSAGKIDTRGLTIKNDAGQVIFGSGTALSTSYISGLGALASQNVVGTNQVSGLGALATQNSVAYSSVTGAKPPTNADNTASNTAAAITNQGTLATRNAVAIGTHVTFPDGSLMNTTDFVNRLSKINNTNISTFMSSAAIGNAYIGIAAIKSANIGDLEVNTINIAGEAVTVPRGASASSLVGTTHYDQTILSLPAISINGGAVILSISAFTFSLTPEGNTPTSFVFSIRRNGVNVFSTSSPPNTTSTLAASFVDYPGSGIFSYSMVLLGGTANGFVMDRTLVAMGAKR